MKRKIRHTYDLHQLLQQSSISAFFDSDEFDQMLLKVANDDVASFRNNNQWLAYHPAEAVIFKDVEGTWDQLKAEYNGAFSNLIYGALPKENLIFETLTRIKKRLENVSWSIEVPPVKEDNTALS